MIINGRFLAQRMTGVQRFAREILLASEGSAWLKDSSIVASPGPDVPMEFAGLPVLQAGQRDGHAWEQLELPQMAGGELLLNLCNTAPMGRKRQLVVLHDAMIAAIPKNFTFMFRMWYQLMIRAYGHRAQLLATVSEFSAREIACYFGIPREKIAVIPESGEHILRAAPDYSIHEKFGLEQEGYYLAVSSLAPNKNFQGILKAVARLPPLPYKFVIVGGRNAKVFGAVDLDAGSAIEVGYVNDSQLRALYERAACFVYPSLYEGFGLPPLEAMCCGCPVLVSETTSLPEVCGDAAAYCRPDDPADIAQELLRLLESRERRAELKEAGLAHTKNWTWAKSAQHLADLTAGA